MIGAVEITRVERNAFERIWPILESTIREGDVYALDSDMPYEDARGYWFASGNHVFVAAKEKEVVGSYFLRANARGGGAHVANAGFVTAPRFRGQGIARTMGEHCAVQARSLGFSAIQFNFVVAANSSAVHLWQSLGYTIVGMVPKAFVLPTGELSDVFVMHRFL